MKIVISLAFSLLLAFAAFSFKEARQLKRELELKKQAVEGLEVKLKTLELAAQAGANLRASSRESSPSLPIPGSAKEENPKVAPLAKENEKTAKASEEQENDTAYRVRARVAAIEKFLPLSTEQKQNLELEFRQGLARGEKSALSEERLAELIGSENARFYEEQKAKAFRAAAREEEDREVFYLSRTLSLNNEQEQALRNALQITEKELSRKLAEDFGQAPDSMQMRIAKFKASNELRQKILGEQLKTILNPEQYSQYLDYSSRNSDQSFTLWHE